VASQLSLQECPLCLEFAHPERTLTGSLDGGRGRVVASADGWALLPSLGAVREHHLMLMPLSHYRSIAYAWERLEHEGLLGLLSLARKTLSQGPCLIFEHGEPESGPQRAGACIDHAHLHILPGYGRLLEKAIWELPFDAECSSFKDAMEQANLDGYQLVGAIAESSVEIHLRSTLGPTPSQFLRRLVAEAAGVGNNWDWRSNWNLPSVERTCHLWRRSVNT
jgi:hypothetical protein